MRPHKCYPDNNFYNISLYKLVQLLETLLQELDALAALATCSIPQISSCKLAEPCILLNQDRYYYVLTSHDAIRI